MKVGIISVGREILRGRVLDTNSNYLARTLTSIGHIVVRISQVDDVQESIIWEINFMASYPVEIIITTGGLGPTGDDITIKSIADAFDVPCRVNRKALEIVKERYNFFYREGAVDSPVITSNRKKMACFPEGATPLYNPVGAAPAMKWEINDIKIYALPGVPSEMKEIFQKEISPELGGSLRYIERFFETPCKDESKLSEYLRIIAEKNPGIYIKSVPEKFGRDVSIKVVIGATGEGKREAEKSINEIYSLLKEKIEEPC